MHSQQQPSSQLDPHQRASAPVDVGSNPLALPHSQLNSSAGSSLHPQVGEAPYTHR